MESVDHGSVQQREDAIGQLMAAMSAIHRQVLALIAEHDASEAWRDDGAATMTAWLQARFSLDRRNAADHVRVAAAMRDLRTISAAYERGRLSWDQVREVTRFATPETDDELAQMAPGLSPRRLQRMAVRTRHVDERLAAETHRTRYLDYSWDETARSLRLNGCIPDADGAVVWKAMHRIASEAPADPETGTRDPYSARCADALVRLASHHLATDADADRATIVVHVDADRLLTGEGPIEIEDGPATAMSTLRRLACDARLQLVAEGSDGDPVGIGRTARTVPGWLRRQLTHRDDGCRFPGCGRTRWTHAHHVEHWADGGATDLDNLVTLCTFHHRLLHEQDWQIRITGSDITWRRPDGTPYAPRPPTLRPAVRTRIVEPVLVAAAAGPP